MASPSCSSSPASPSSASGGISGAYSAPFLILLLLVLLSSSSLLLLLLPSSAPSDLSLLRRAALLTNTDANGSVAAGGKVALMFLTNSNLTFAPLWDRFLRGHSAFFNLYVHADPAADVAAPGGEFPRTRFIPARPTRRASPALIAAARRLLAHALLHDPANAFFALLSQHCVPLHSFPYAYRTILRGNRRSFIEILSGEPGIWDRYIARGVNVMMPEIPFDQFRVGSQFFILTRKHALMVVKDSKLWNKFRLPCLEEHQHSCYPEEHYFPTLLSMEDPGGCTNYTLTRVNWTGSADGHPHTYGPGEVSAELVAELRRSNFTYSYLFARKFAPESLGPLMQIADDAIFRD